MNKFVSFSILALLLSISNAVAEEIKSEPGQRSDLKITIYNENLALVKDKRKVGLHAGLNDVAYIGVSSAIVPESALITGDKIRVLEQNFNYDLMSPDSIIRKSVGEKVKLIETFNDGKTTEVDAEILSVNDGVVYKVGDKIEVAPRGRVVFSSLPKNLRDKPTLVMTIESQDDSEKTVELSYLTSGLSWNADYIAELDDTDTKMNFSGLVTLNNLSGVSYDNVSLQLVAGDVKVVKRRMRPRMMMVEADSFAVNSVSRRMANEMREESFADYHLYSLPRKVNIADKQTKQISLLEAQNIASVKEYVYDNPFFHGETIRNTSKENINPSSNLKFSNKKSNNLGIAIPKGIIRVYKHDSKGNMLFVGSDEIKHTPSNSDVEIKLGNAFDITADVTVVEAPSYHGRRNYAMTMNFKNASDTDKTVFVRQNFFNKFFIEKESIASSDIKFNAKKEWRVHIPAKGSSLLKVDVYVNEPEKMHHNK